MTDQTIHQRPRSKFRLPPPIQKNGRASGGNQASIGNSRPRSSLPLPPPRFNAKDSGISSSSTNSDVMSNHIDNMHSLAANNVPGRPRRRQHPHTAATGNGIHTHSDNAPSTKEHSPTKQYNLPVPAAVLLWYLLGVVSISSSKVLLSSYEVPPLLLTLQQLIIGISLLRTLLLIGDESDGLQPIPMQNYSVVIEGCSSGDMCEIGSEKRKSSNGSEAKTGIVSSILAIISTKLQAEKETQRPHIDLQLLLSAIYFTLGFLMTNYGFRSGSAAFVETIKAAEPITSASAAVAWGIERLGKEEVVSLAGIVVGVILSTVGQRVPKAEVESHQSTLMAFLIVMLSNLCFSFRGLHQKLFRASPQGKATSVNDLNLQFRMQQVGVLLLLGPAVLGNGLWTLHRSTLFDTGALMHYIPLALVNGIAFTSYNLASTYVLTRISVVHHAALNCIRRVFAVVVTSTIFGLSISGLQVLGILTSVGGFFSFSHFKLKKVRKEKRRRDLRKKYGVPARNKDKSKWNESKGWADEKKEADSAV